MTHVIKLDPNEVREAITDHLAKEHRALLSTKAPDCFVQVAIAFTDAHGSATATLSVQRNPRDERG